MGWSVICLLIDLLLVHYDVPKDLHRLKVPWLYCQWEKSTEIKQVLYLYQPLGISRKGHYSLLLLIVIENFVFSWWSRLGKWGIATTTLVHLCCGVSLITFAPGPLSKCYHLGILMYIFVVVLAYALKLSQVTSGRSLIERSLLTMAILSGMSVHKNGKY